MGSMYLEGTYAGDSGQMGAAEPSWPGVHFDDQSAGKWGASESSAVQAKDTIPLTFLYML